MKIGVITYDTRHLKTEQVALGLRALGDDELHFFALPFVERPARQIVFAHRPDMMTGAHSRAVAQAVKGSFTSITSVDEIAPDACDVFLVGGAGLLPASWVGQTRGKVVNSHPGIIPLVRGLDAFKWAIVDEQPIGNTLHFIDEEADAGEVFAQVATPVFRTDSLGQFAQRHYEVEIAMMIGFQTLLSSYREGRTTFPQHPERPARMRMKAEIQDTLHDAFARYKDRFAQD